MVASNSPLMPGDVERLRKRRRDMGWCAGADNTWIEARKTGLEISVELVAGLL
jgi:hypothetical protein